jgi:hypothetical protein
VAVSAERLGVLRASFEAGEVRRFDVSPLLTRGVLQLIAKAEAFESVSVVEGGGGVEWDAGPDLSANRLYFDGEPVSRDAGTSC